MLSSSKSTALLLLLLFAALLATNAALPLRELGETTTAADNQKEEGNAKNVKFVFPSNDDSEEESKFDVHGWKTTPPPDENKVVTGGKVNTTSEATVMETTTVDSITAEIGNTELPSLDDRLGIFNLPPRCRKGQVIVRQRCHNLA